MVPLVGCEVDGRHVASRGRRARRCVVIAGADGSGGRTSDAVCPFCGCAAGRAAAESRGFLCVQYLPVRPLQTLRCDTVQIPNRSLFRQPEVCEIAQVQPYVLRSWEAEFPDLGVAKTEGGPRVYRRADVERVLRIKHLLFVEGLTLAGARRKLQDEQPAARTGRARTSTICCRQRRARADHAR